MASPLLTWFHPLKTRLTLRSLRGKRAEQAACGLLAREGYVISERNVRFPVGEIDIVARDGSTLCFVEVRSTSSSQWGGPVASIDDRKRRRLVKAAHWYLHYCPVRAIETRFDVVAIEWRADDAPAMELVKGAFTADT